MSDTLEAQHATPRRLRHPSVIARRQWWVVVVCVVLAAAGAAVSIETTAAKYAASAVVSIVAPTTSSEAASSPGATAITPLGPDPVSELQQPSVQQAAAAAAHIPAGAVNLSGSNDAATGTFVITATTPSSARSIAAVNAAAAAFATHRIADLRSEVSALDPALAALSAQISALEGQGGTNNATGPTSGGNVAASTKLGVATAAYQSLYQQQQTLTLDVAYVNVTSSAHSSSEANGTSKKKTLGLALVIGLFAGCGLALLRDLLDDRVRVGDDLQIVADSKVLARLPISGNGQRSKLLSDGASDDFAESVRELRTALQFLSARHPLRAILVTSAEDEEGRSFVASNLAVALAISGARTVLISSDLRNASIEGIFGLDPAARGLTDAVRDQQIVDADQLLLPTSLHGLAVMPKGSDAQNPSEILGSPVFASLLTHIKSQCDVVVLDSPAVSAVTDALVLTTHVDGVVFVVAEDLTRTSSARLALARLGDGMAPVVGLVTNFASKPASGKKARAKKRKPGVHRPAPANGAVPRSAASEKPLSLVPRSTPSSWSDWGK